MTGLLHNLALGFSVAFTLQHVGLALVGCLIGTLIGVLPGIGPIATITMLLPITFGLEPTGSIILLAGIYHGDPREHPGRGDRGGDDARRARDGEAGTRRRRARDRRDRLVLRGHARD